MSNYTCRHMTSNTPKLPRQILLRSTQGIWRPYCHFRHNGPYHSSGSSRDYQIRRNYSLDDPHQYLRILKRSAYFSLLQRLSKFTNLRLCTYMPAVCVAMQVSHILWGVCGQVVVGHSCTEIIWSQRVDGDLSFTW